MECGWLESKSEELESKSTLNFWLLVSLPQLTVLLFNKPTVQGGLLRNQGIREAT
jgi:hypothetical protein